VGRSAFTLVGRSAFTLAGTLTVLDIDHVLIAVGDLEKAAGDLEARFSVASIPGGHHTGWGTANRIISLGETYLELVAVIDKHEASQSAFGSWVARPHPHPNHPLGWAVRVNNLGPVAERLSLVMRAGSRLRADGVTLRWRTGGIERAASEPSLPFFIEWGQETPFPGGVVTSHAAGRVELRRLLLDGDAARLEEWLGPNQLPITMRAGVPSVTEIVLSRAAGEIVLNADSLNGR
jgi:hypothetical protein